MALTDEDVGRFIQRLRVERGMTQADLARRVRMHRTAISRLENGFRAVTVPELVEFASVLNITAGSTAILNELPPPGQRQLPMDDRGKLNLHYRGRTRPSQLSTRSPS